MQERHVEERQEAPVADARREVGLERRHDLPVDLDR